MRWARQYWTTLEPFTTGWYTNEVADESAAAINANMYSAIDMIRRSLDGMIERRFGRIVNITSAAVKAPIDVLGLSNGARSGLTGFVAGLARQPLVVNLVMVPNLRSVGKKLVGQTRVHLIKFLHRHLFHCPKLSKLCATAHSSAAGQEIKVHGDASNAEPSAGGIALAVRRPIARSLHHNGAN